MQDQRKCAYVDHQTLVFISQFGWDKVAIPFVHSLSGEYLATGLCLEDALTRITVILAFIITNPCWDPETPLHFIFPAPVRCSQQSRWKEGNQTSSLFPWLYLKQLLKLEPNVLLLLLP